MLLFYRCVAYQRRLCHCFVAAISLQVYVYLLIPCLLSIILFQLHNIAALMMSYDYLH